MYTLKNYITNTFNTNTLFALFIVLSTKGCKQSDKISNINCTVPTSISRTNSSNGIFEYRINPVNESDLKQVSWVILQGSDTLFWEVLEKKTSIRYVYPTSNTYYVSAIIETKCGEKKNIKFEETITEKDLPKLPNILWDKTYGGSESDKAAKIIKTTDGGYLITGSSWSNISGDKSEKSRGFDDFWIIKINESGTKIWDKTIGGNGGDWSYDILQTNDGNYIIVGYSESNFSGEKTESSKGGNDFWIVKINNSGQKIWDKTIGGSSGSGARAILPTSDGGIILVGDSNSKIAFDKSENNRGSNDYWVIKIDNNGQKIWDKTIGGSNYDQVNSIVETKDGGYILVGRSNSPKSFEKSENSKGDYDFWIVKINSNGDKIWDRIIGGNKSDIPYSITSTSDGNYIIVGKSDSNKSGEKTENVKGGWIVYINDFGQVIWDKSIENSQLNSIVSMSDGTYLIAGNKEQLNSNGGLNDFLALKINSNGHIFWKKIIGGGMDDGGNSAIANSDGSFIIVGSSNSNASSDKSINSKGGFDFWVVKLK